MLAINQAKYREKSIYLIRAQKDLPLLKPHMGLLSGFWIASAIVPRVNIASEHKSSLMYTKALSTCWNQNHKQPKMRDRTFRKKALASIITAISAQERGCTNAVHNSGIVHSINILSRRTESSCWKTFKKTWIQCMAKRIICASRETSRCDSSKIRHADFHCW